MSLRTEVMQKDQGLINSELSGSANMYREAGYGAGRRAGTPLALRPHGMGEAGRLCPPGQPKGNMGTRNLSASHVSV